MVSLISDTIKTHPMTSEKKKYRLFGQPEGAPCAFFASQQGCRNGSNCKFLHVSATNPLTDPVVTSSENQKTHVSFQQPIISTLQNENHDVFASPGEIPQPSVATNSSNGRNKKRKSTLTSAVTLFANSKAIGSKTDINTDGNHPTMFVNTNKKNASVINTSTNIVSSPLTSDVKSQSPAINASKIPIIVNRPTKVIVQQSPPPTASYSSLAKLAEPPKNIQQDESVTPPSKKQKASKVNNLQPSGHVSFRDLDLPIAGFSSLKKETDVPIGESPKLTKKSESLSDDEYVLPPNLPIPKSTPEGIKWQSACLMSRANPKFATSYNYEKYKKIDAKIGSIAPWIKARPYGQWCRSNPHAIAVDCEMCETKCPITGKTDHKALCRLSVVNANEPNEVLLDTLVKPDWPVVDHRSRINGIEAGHLESVQFTLKHAQAFMMALCSDETVILGHAVHNDLVALKMEHYCVVDSSLLFELLDEPGTTASLKDLAMNVLQCEMPDVHDSVNDAKVALHCLEQGYLEKGGCPEPLKRCFPPKNRINQILNDSSLLVHRIPKICKEEHIMKMFLSHTSIQPQEVPPITFTGETGKVTVPFRSFEHALLAFTSLTGSAKPDLSGRLQKRVFLKNGDYIQIRINKKLKPEKVELDN